MRDLLSRTVPGIIQGRVKRHGSVSSTGVSLDYKYDKAKWSSLITCYKFETGFLQQQQEAETFIDLCFRGKIFIHCSREGGTTATIARTTRDSVFVFALLQHGLLVES